MSEVKNKFFFLKNSDAGGLLSNCFYAGHLRIWEVVAGHCKLELKISRKNEKRKHGKFNLSFPKFGRKKSLITYHNLSFSIKNKGEIKIQNKPFMELSFGVTHFRNIVRKHENIHGSINGCDGKTMWWICRESDLSLLRHRNNNNNNKL